MKKRIVTITFEVETDKSISSLRNTHVCDLPGMQGGRLIPGMQGGRHHLENVEKPKVNVIRATKKAAKRKCK